MEKLRAKPCIGCGWCCRKARCIFGISSAENQMKIMEIMVNSSDWTVSLSGSRLARKTAKGMLRRGYAVAVDNRGEPALKLTTYGRQIYRKNLKKKEQ